MASAVDLPLASVPLADAPVLSHRFHELFVADESKEASEKKTKKDESKKKSKETSKAGKKKKKEKAKKLSAKLLRTFSRPDVVLAANPSNFSIFAKVRAAVLCQELEKNQSAILSSLQDAGDSDSDDDDDEQMAMEVEVPQVVSMGLRGVFELIRETRTIHPAICCRALSALLDVLQGQEPEALRTESPKSLKALFDVLREIVGQPMESSPPGDVSSLHALACSCMLSLVAAWGQTGYILSAISTVLTAAAQHGDHLIQVPHILTALQSSVQSFLTGYSIWPDWRHLGLPSSGLIDKWPTVALPQDGSSNSSIASDGTYLYVKTNKGLFKLGTGHEGSIKGHLYAANHEFHCDERGWLGFVAGKLFYHPLGLGDATVYLVRTDTLQETGSTELEGSSSDMGPELMFTDGTSIGQIQSNKEAALSLKLFDPSATPLKVMESHELVMASHTLLACGKADYLKDSSLHVCYKDAVQDAVVAAAREFCFLLKSSGTLLYTGESSAVAMSDTGASKPGLWEELMEDVKVVATGHYGSFAIAVTKDGVAHFFGTARHGEDGQKAKGRRQCKAVRGVKMVAKLADVQIANVACSASASGLVSTSGQLYMFGKDVDCTDPSSGVVTGLLGIPVSSVALGKGHTLALLQSGQVYSFGHNHRGQCGRDAEGAAAAGTEDVSDSESSEEEDAMCPSGEHTWTNENCMICMFCHNCTGYGPGCCNSGMPDRNPGGPCGCGSGDSGCSTCGACRNCAQQASGQKKSKKDKEKSKGKGKKKEKDAKKKDKGGAKASSLTKSPALIPDLPADMPALQVSAGHFHSAVLLMNGDVYTFGYNTDGQLGLGDTTNRFTPCKVALPSEAQQVVCGGHHTVVLLKDGHVATFGRRANCQLGRSAPSGDKKWHASPALMSNIGPEHGRRATWIGAGALHTIVQFSESLLTADSLRQASVFADNNCIGIVRGDERTEKSTLVYNRASQHLEQFTDDQADVSNKALCLDPTYGTLYSYRPEEQEVQCFDVVASKARLSSVNKASFGSSVFSPELSLPRQSLSNIPRSQASLHLLACLSSLNAMPLPESVLSGTVVPGSPVSLALSQPNTESTSCDYSVANRFSSTGGAWGYSRHAVEAISFMPDRDIWLYGFGLWGGRGEYHCNIKVFLDDTNQDLAETPPSSYTCPRGEPYDMLFDKPVHLKANTYYTAWASISGTNSDSGSSGRTSFSAEDQGETVHFQIRSSSLSTNGTDLNNGQIPTFLFKVHRQKEASSKSSQGVNVHVLRKDFPSNVSMEGFEALHSLLRWSWSALCRGCSESSIAPGSGLNAETQGMLVDLQRLAYVSCCCLRLLATFVNEIYPKPGIKKGSVTETTELTRMVGESRALLCMILREEVPLERSGDSRAPLSILQDTLDECYKTFVACFHAFYPSVQLRWVVLCTLLQANVPSRSDDVISSSVAGGSRLVAAVLHSLCSPTEQLLTTISSLPDQSGDELLAIISRTPPQYPQLEDHMVQRIEEHGGTLSSSFRQVLAQLLTLVVNPLHKAIGVDAKRPMISEQVVTNAGHLLSAIVSQLAMCAVLHTSVVHKDLAKATVLETKNRYNGTNQSNWNCGDGNADAVQFTTDSDILLVGCGVYGGLGVYRWSMELHEKADSKASNWTMIGEASGEFQDRDLDSNHIARLHFRQPIAIQSGTPYSIVFRNTGSRTNNGFSGVTQVECSDGVGFMFEDSSLSKNGTNASRGQIPFLLYINSAAEAEKQKKGKSLASTQNISLSRRNSVTVAKTVLELCTDVLECARAVPLQRKDQTPPQLLGSSYLFSTLLPLALAYLGPIAMSEPGLAVEMLELIERILPSVTSLNKAFPPPLNEQLVAQADKGGEEPMEVSTGTEEHKEDVPRLSVPTHHVVVESDHPYRMAAVTNYEVCMPETVRWMMVEFDERCGTAQPEDQLHLYLPGISSKGNTNVMCPAIGDAFHGAPGSESWPTRSLVLPGHRLHFFLETASDYVKDEKSCRFGFRCTVTGYEWSPSPHEGIVVLERELAFLASHCSQALLQDDIDVPDVGGDDDINPMVKQLVAEDIMSKYSDVLGQGLQLSHIPSIDEVLAGRLPCGHSSSEMQFLQDVIAAVADTSGGRLARWLQADQCIDTSNCQLRMASEHVYERWRQHVLTLQTCDRRGRLMFAPSMRVECVATPAEAAAPKLDPSILKSLKKANFDVPFAPVEQLKTFFQSITAMPAYKEFSFEELRLQAPKQKPRPEVMECISCQNGQYEILWSPSHRGKYSVCARIDGVVAGQSIEIEVEEPEPGATPPVLLRFATPMPETQASVPGKWMIFKLLPPKKLRIRSGASLQAPEVSLLSHKSVLLIDESASIANDDGKWVRLTKVCSQHYCPNHQGEAWVLAYSSANSTTLLDDYEPQADDLARFPGGASKGKAKGKDEKKKKKKVKMSKGGPGDYFVVHCGSGGHNIRNQPSLKATPVGLLTRGCAITAVESVTRKDGLWLRLCDANVDTYCESKTESWTLACSASGTMYIRKKGEDAPEQKSKSSTKSATGFSFGQAAEFSFGPPAQPVQVGDGSAAQASGFSFGALAEPVQIGNVSPAPAAEGGFAAFAPRPFGLQAFGAPQQVRVDLFGGLPQGGGLFGAQAFDANHQPGNVFVRPPPVFQQPQQGGGLFGPPRPPFGPFGGPPQGGGLFGQAGTVFGAAKQEAAAEEQADADTDTEKASEEEKKPDDSSSPPRKRRLQKNSDEQKKSDELPATEGLATASSNPSVVDGPASPAGPPPTSKPSLSGPLSPAVAECLRAVLCAFLWHECLVHDAMACASYLKFHPELMVEKSAGETKDAEMPDVSDAGDGPVSPTKESPTKESPTKESPSKELTAKESKESLPTSSPALPPTLNYLLRIYQRLSSVVLKALEDPMPTKLTVPPSVKNLIAKAEKAKKKVKVEEKKQAAAAAVDGVGAGDLCELCDTRFRPPVTYHMRQAHPGCGQHARSMGYNSQGRYYGGWAGNCGDGGMRGSQWFLMCESCRSRYLEEKAAASASSKLSEKAKSKSHEKGLSKVNIRSLPHLAPYEVITENARFLLMLAPSRLSSDRQHTDSTSSEPAATRPGKQFEFLRLSSLPMLETSEADVLSPDKLLRTLSAEQPPGDKRSSQLPSDIVNSNRPGFQRSVSMQVSAVVQKDPGNAAPIPTPLVQKPSHLLAKIVVMGCAEGAEDVLKRNAVLRFAAERHDLTSLKWAMQHAMQLSVCRKYALDSFQWLLRRLTQPSSLHDVLWTFSSSLVAGSSEKELQSEDEEKARQEDFAGLGEHPLHGLTCSGQQVFQPVQEAFHELLRCITDLMLAIPPGSDVQQAAIRCLALRFHTDDHAFLHRGQVFASISQILAKVDEECSRAIAAKDSWPSIPCISQMCDVMPLGCELKTSSRQAMANSLKDGDTETFWESGDDDNVGRVWLRLDCPETVKPFAMCVHIDNSRDNANRVSELSLLIGETSGSLKKVKGVDLAMRHAGWVVLPIPQDNSPVRVIKVELKALQQTVRVRQLQLLGTTSAQPAVPVASLTPHHVAKCQACQTEALRVFRQLTSQVFGHLLTGDKADKTAKAPLQKDEESTDLREQVVGILFSEGKQLTQLQKQVCEQMVRSLCSESGRVREAWNSTVAKAVPCEAGGEATAKAAPQDHIPPAGGDGKKGHPAKAAAAAAAHEQSGAAGDSKLVDAYCGELLSMLLSLSGSDVGSAYLAQQSNLLVALTSLLHTGSSPVQLQALSLLSRILPHVQPGQFAFVLDVSGLPPSGFSAIMFAEQRANAGVDKTPIQPGVLDIFLACISKALSVQTRTKGAPAKAQSGVLGGKGVFTVTSHALLETEEAKSANPFNRWFMVGTVTAEVATAVIHFLNDMCAGKISAAWKDVAISAIGQLVMSLTTMDDELHSPEPCMHSHQVWLSLASLCVLNEGHIEKLSSGQWQDEKPSAGQQEKPNCDNHDDGETRAIVQCNVCGNLCGECDRVLHLPKRNKSHQRQLFKEEEEAIKVEVHEGSGRVKLFWLMALADPKALRAMVEFRYIQKTGAAGSGTCRFCGSGGAALLAVGYVCSDPDCQERARNVCPKQLACRHMCGGVRGEQNCLPCLHGCKTPESSDGSGVVLRQDADDMCVICYTEPISAAPAIQLSCGHVYHMDCCRRQLESKWSGPRITFRFIMCPICENKEIGHPLLMDVLEPMVKLYEEVKRKALMRLEYENQMKNEAVTNPSSKFYNQPALYAMDRYAYYVCHKCNKAYYGGEARCIVQAGLSDEYDPAELVCGGCSDVVGGQVCAKHGTDFLEYKCRYCCSVAVYFCFGTTHFCSPCHDDFQRLTGMDKSLYPSCPVGPRATPLDVEECPLKIKHPPTGEEFALGCGVCRNAQTF